MTPKEQQRLDEIRQQVDRIDDEIRDLEQQRREAMRADRYNEMAQGQLDARRDHLIRQRAATIQSAFGIGTKDCIGQRVEFFRERIDPHSRQGVLVDVWRHLAAVKPDPNHLGEQDEEAICDIAQLRFLDGDPPYDRFPRPPEKAHSPYQPA